MQQKIELIDSHAHIYLSQFEDKEQLMNRVRSAGVTQVILPNIDRSTLPLMMDMANDFPDVCKPTIGLHPCHVEEDFRVVLSEFELLLAEDNSFVGIGETGVDLYWDPSTKERQQQSFDIQIQWAKSTGLPIIIHSRDSLDLTIEMIEDAQDGNLQGVFHCFNGTVEQGKRIQDIGFYMGLGGVITYQNAGMGEVLAHLDIDSMMLETDSPYLTPVEFRKKGVFNEPTYMPSILRRLSKILNKEESEVAAKTTENAKMCFGLS